jgi:zinc protease
MDPTLFRVLATVRSGGDVDTVEAAAHAEIARLQQEPVGESELARVRRQAQAQFVYLRDGVSRKAVALGAFAAVDSPGRLRELTDAVQHVMPDDIMRVARAYLLETRRTVGRYVPDGGMAREVSA